MPGCLSIPPCFVEPEKTGDTGPVRVAQWYGCGHIIQSSSLLRAPTPSRQILIASSTSFFRVRRTSPSATAWSCQRQMQPRSYISPSGVPHCLRNPIENIVGNRKSDFHRCWPILPSEMAGLLVRISFGVKRRACACWPLFRRAIPIGPSSSSIDAFSPTKRPPGEPLSVAGLFRQIPFKQLLWRSRASSALDRAVPRAPASRDAPPTAARCAFHGRSSR
ncbi:hypothetical protein QFZ98_003528 [Paraburkholderia youngii]